MTRFLPLALLILFASSVLSAQDPGATPAPSDESSPVVVEMKIQRSLSPDSNGVADLLPGVEADRLILQYVLQNIGVRDVEIARMAISDQVNCNVVVTSRPETMVAASSATTMVLEVMPLDRGPFSFVVSMAVDGREYSFQVQTTVTALLDHEHDHHDDDGHHCSAGIGGSWLLFGGVAALLGTLMFRRRAA
jgi:hypothetical protein